MTPRVCVPTVLLVRSYSVGCSHRREISSVQSGSAGTRQSDLTRWKQQAHLKHVWRRAHVLPDA